MDKYKRVINCPWCKSSIFIEVKGKCSVCGRPTYYYGQKLIKPWQEELDDMAVL